MIRDEKVEDNRNESEGCAKRSTVRAGAWLDVCY